MKYINNYFSENDNNDSDNNEKNKSFYVKLLEVDANNLWHYFIKNIWWLKWFIRILKKLWNLEKKYLWTNSLNKFINEKYLEKNEFLDFLE